MPSIGPMELAIVVLVALLIFGPKKLPSLGKGLGQGMREFKESLTTEHPSRSALEEGKPPGTSRRSPENEGD